MKKNITRLLLIIIATFILLPNFAFCGKGVKFVTLGNCVLCKNRIEKSVNSLPGITTVYWDANEQATSVVYDESQTDLIKIMHTIADVGHDTEWYKAFDLAYGALVGSCCEYKRTIDYTKVQIGYLSLMNLWVSVNEDNQSASDFSVHPSLVLNNSINVQYKGLSINKVNLSVYSLSGNNVYSEEINPINISQINVSSFARGEYMIIITDNVQIVYKTKIVIL